jgi:hypothetical protein
MLVTYHKTIISLRIYYIYLLHQGGTLFKSILKQGTYSSILSQSDEEGQLRRLQNGELHTYLLSSHAKKYKIIP